MSWNPLIPGPPGWPSSCLLTVVLLAGLLSTGCIDAPSQNATDEDRKEDVEISNGTVLPDPVVLEGTATVANPAHSAFCLRDSVDGEYHKLPRNVDDWRYRLEPEGLTVYWFDADEDYLEGGAHEGTVPKGATFAEVCKAKGAGPTDYTLTIIHPHHDRA